MVFVCLLVLTALGRARYNKGMLRLSQKNQFKISKRVKDFWGRWTGDAFVLVKIVKPNLGSFGVYVVEIPGVSVIDLVGQVLTQRPQPKHLAGLKTSVLSWFSCLALN